jgi:hypothetical protein
MTTQEKLDAILHAVSKEKDVECKQKNVEESYPTKNKEVSLVHDTLYRIGFMILLDLLLFIATAIIYSFDSAVFGISLGFFMAAMIITFILIIDWKVIPGDTIRKISDSSVALALLLFIIACSIWVGILVGDSYHPQAITGEAKSGRAEEIYEEDELRDTIPLDLDNR